MIIKHPMDFSTMKEKIKNNDYQSIEELKVTIVIYVVIGQIRAMIQSNIFFIHLRVKLLDPIYI